MTARSTVSQAALPAVATRVIAHAQCASSERFAFNPRCYCYAGALLDYGDRTVYFKSTGNSDIHREVVKAAAGSVISVGEDYASAFKKDVEVRKPLGNGTYPRVSELLPKTLRAPTETPSFSPRALAAICKAIGASEVVTIVETESGNKGAYFIPGQSGAFGVIMPYAFTPNLAEYEALMSPFREPKTEAASNAKALTRVQATTV